MKKFDVVIIGAGAAGLMCAIQAGKRGRRVLLVDHSKKIAEKIRISGGGRCNFTNIHAAPDRYISANPHFCKSALRQYTQHDFIEMVKRHGIAFHEKTLGQLFCDNSAQDIIDMLVKECAGAGVTIQMGTGVDHIARNVDDNKMQPHYVLDLTNGSAIACESLVIATGGLSIPKIGATKFGYDIARQFGLNVLPTRAGLVPLTFQADILEHCKALSGLSVQAGISCGKTDFAEGMLFTHRGLSGPSVLQISSYWREGEDIVVDLAHGSDVYATLKKHKDAHPKQDIQNALAEILPKRLAGDICDALGLNGRIAELADKKLEFLARRVNAWRVRPGGTEGYRTAEVTLGGVDTNELSSKTMEAKNVAGLYFIGEVVDVTGHLGGFNFQWAWSSGYAAGCHV